MSAAATSIRLAAFAALTAGLLAAALAFVPGTDLGIQARSFAFVFVAPWLAALLVVHPARLARAFSTVFAARGAEGLGTARTLDLVAGLTVAVGAVGLFSSFFTFQVSVAMSRGSLEPDRLGPGVIYALAVPPAFALIARFVLFEPVIVALRRRCAPVGEAIEGRPRVHTAWKVILIVLASVLATEGFRALWLRPAEKAPRDTSFVAVGKDPATGQQSPDLGPDAPPLYPPIRVEIVREGSGIVCRVDGEALAARPGLADELCDRIRALATDGTFRRVEIEAEREVPFLHLVAAVDAAIRATKQEEPYLATRDEEEEVDEAAADQHDRPVRQVPPFSRRVRLLVPTAEALVVPLELRLVHEHYEQQHIDIVILQLPCVEQVETVIVDADDAPPCINVTWDAEVALPEIRVGRDAMDSEELAAWIRNVAGARRDPSTGVSEVAFLLRCDRSAHVGAVYRILALLGSPECKVRHVLIAGRPRWPGER